MPISSETKIRLKTPRIGTEEGEGE